MNIWNIEFDDDPDYDGDWLMPDEKAEAEAFEEYCEIRALRESRIAIAELIQN